ncbi:hypothetical protein H2203_005316 [Taxawa tesnikishii (nom. ined.)]|nr:hypothetical protein H2203_005316 [Dothideales sp. JES 119]
MPPTPLRFEYKRVDDCIICTDVYLPSQSQIKGPKCPVVLGIHGGAFMLGSSSMVNADQIDDCLSRGWILLSLDHRLCPQVDIFAGPVTDCRDALAWVYDGGLEKALKGTEEGKQYEIDHDRVVAFGTSSGGTLALSLGFSVPRPVAAILNLYGATHFTHPFWSQPLPHVKPPPCPEDLMNSVYHESPIPTQGPPPRVSFALTQIHKGTVLDACMPSKAFEKIDACLNVTDAFPPTIVVHGDADTMVPKYLSEKLFEELKAKG